MLAIMEKYANTLESLVDERTVQLAQEKKTTESLLLRMLPKSVYSLLFSFFLTAFVSRVLRSLTS
jgi:hypothetical protein